MERGLRLPPRSTFPLAATWGMEELPEGGSGNPSSSSAKRLERVGHTMVGCSAVKIDPAVGKWYGARHPGTIIAGVS